uniref:Uncharacterized protein n=1 Tax=Romanomermis culicivorax TaxID=13658 RepID=A0A915KS84_ROMCU
MDRATGAVPRDEFIHSYNSGENNISSSRTVLAAILQIFNLSLVNRAESTVAAIELISGTRTGCETINDFSIYKKQLG